MATLTSTNEVSQSAAFTNGGHARKRGAQPRGILGINEKQLARGLGWFSIGLGVAELIAPRSIARLVGWRNHSPLIRAYGLRELAAGIGILTAVRPGGWLWARAAGDMVDLASLGSVLGSPENDTGRAAFAIASVTGVTVLDVLCAQKLCGSEPGAAKRTGRAETSIIVNKSPEECYRFWRNFENLPRFMSYLQSVRVTDGRQSHWMATVAGTTVEWDAQIETDVPNERISWQSLPGSEVSNSGAIGFERAPGGRGTIVRVQMDYGNLLHALGAVPATAAGRNPEQIIRKELRRFKQVMETGEVITTEGQPAGRRSSVTWLDHIAR